MPTGRGKNARISQAVINTWPSSLPTSSCHTFGKRRFESSQLLFLTLLRGAAPPDTHLGDVLWMPIFQLPLEQGSGCRKVLQERLRDEGSGNKTAAGIIPASAAPRSCALGEKGRGAQIDGFRSGEEVEQVLRVCGRTWEIKPENCCREPEILWSARDHGISQE